MSTITNGPATGEIRIIRRPSATTPEAVERRNRRNRTIGVIAASVAAIATAGAVSLAITATRASDFPGIVS